METVGERIRLIRRDNSLTQLELSKKLCVSRPHLTNIENNKECASKPVLRLIGILFNVSEDWLTNG